MSRLMDHVTPPEHQLAGSWRTTRRTATAYRKGADPLLDRALDRIEKIEELLHHGRTSVPIEDTAMRMAEFAAGPVGKLR